MANFVLVHGAWHGAWVWSRVLPLLHSGSHTAHAVTLTGVADRLLAAQSNRLCHLVYLDASIPKPGEAWGDKHAQATRSAHELADDLLRCAL